MVVFVVGVSVRGFKRLGVSVRGFGEGFRLGLLPGRSSRRPFLGQAPWFCSGEGGVLADVPGRRSPN